MATDNRLAALKEKHAELEQAIALENSRPHPDDLLIQRLKREKLKIKDTIARVGAESA
jgi:Uncharacterized small protein